jgi:hypothetical protein
MGRVGSKLIDAPIFVGSQRRRIVDTGLADVRPMYRRNSGLNRIEMVDAPCEPLGQLESGIAFPELKFADMR